MLLGRAGALQAHPSFSNLRKSPSPIRVSADPESQMLRPIGCLRPLRSMMKASSMRVQGVYRRPAEESCGPPCERKDAALGEGLLSVSSSETAGVPACDEDPSSGQARTLTRCRF